MRFARTNTVVRLATKDYAQPKDQTLTDLSGKDKAELRTYLDLKSAAKRDVGSGANQIPDMNDFTSSLTSPGWQKLPSGLIIQWGTANPSSTGEIFITFPVAFSAYPMYVGFGPQQASLPNVVQSPVISAPTITNLGCGVRNLMIPTAGGAPVASMSSFFWIAVGK
ncbi:gp53-like domain-containing protein [Escherichia coli]